MLCFGVVEKNGLSEIISEGLSTYGYGVIFISKDKTYRLKGKRKEEIVLISAGDLSFGKFSKPELIIFAPECAETAYKRTRISCAVAAIPGESSIKAAPLVKAGYIVSYGMSPKDTVTVSSIDQNSIVLSLQREIIDLKNKKIERQDIPLAIGNKSAEIVVASAAALMLSGIPAAYLKEIFS